MSSYDKFFFEIQKYELSVFKRTMNRVPTMPSYVSHFDTYAFESAQKAMSCMIPIYQSGVFSQNVDFITSDDASYQNVQHCFRTFKGHVFSLRKSQEHPCQFR